ncbi:MAG: hypothetical protein ACXWLU_13865 [Thermoanaerobaculia bacterium]
MLTNIVQGSVFIEGRDVGGLSRPTSTEDVWAYSHALSVIQDLNVQGGQLTEAFQGVREALLTLATTAGIATMPPSTLDALEKVFNTFNRMFYTDIYNGLLPTRSADDDPHMGARF